MMLQKVAAGNELFEQWHRSIV